MNQLDDISCAPYFSADQTARIVGVNSHTVRIWFDRGLLAHHRLPGSNRWRVRRADLLRFIGKYGIPREALQDDVFSGVELARHGIVGLEPAVPGPRLLARRPRSKKVPVAQRRQAPRPA